MSKVVVESDFQLELFGGDTAMTKGIVFVDELDREDGT